MKTLIILIMVCLASCARVSVQTTDDNGRDWKVTSSTFAKKLEGVGVEVGEVKFNLGSSSSDSPVPPELIACLIAPVLCK